MTFEKRLLKLLSQHEFLHNPEHEDYDNVSKRKAVWQSISKTLRADESYCRSRWYSIRNTYRKLLYKIKSDGGFEEYRNKWKWKYYDDIAFINKYTTLPPLVDFNASEWKAEGATRESLPDVSKGYGNHLIKLIQQHELLYNPKCEGFDNHRARDNAWQTISKKLNVPKDIIKVKWHSCRSTYSKILRKIHASGGDITTYTRRWQYFDDMYFLNPYITNLPPGVIDKVFVNPERKLSAEILYNDDFADSSLDIKTSHLSFDANSMPEDETSYFESLEDKDAAEDLGIRKHEINMNYEKLDDDLDEEANIEGECVVFDSSVKSKKGVKRKHNKEKEKPKCRSNFSLTSSIDEGGPCSKYFSLLGSKIDETAVPEKVRFELEKRVTDLVYDVLTKYSLETVDV